MDTEQTGAETTVESTQETVPEQEVQEESVETLKEKLKTLEDRNKELEDKKRELEAAHQADTERFTRFKKEKPQDNLRADIEALNKKVELMMRHQSGGETADNLEQKLAQIDAEYKQKRSAVESQATYMQHVQESFESIREILAEVGLNPESQDSPEVKYLHEKWDEALKNGKSLDGVVKEASKVALKKLKTQPDEKKLKEDVKKEILEEKKKSSALKVDTASPLGGGLSDTEFYKRWGRGELDSTPENKKRARDIHIKTLQGG